jgi:hypothetical protein
LQPSRTPSHNIFHDIYTHLCVCSHVDIKIFRVESKTNRMQNRVRMNPSSVISVLYLHTIPRKHSLLVTACLSHNLSSFWPPFAGASALGALRRPGLGRTYQHGVPRNRDPSPVYRSNRTHTPRNRENSLSLVYAACTCTRAAYTTHMYAGDQKYTYSRTLRLLHIDTHLVAIIRSSLYGKCIPRPTRSADSSARSQTKRRTERQAAYRHMNTLRDQLEAFSGP